MLFFPSFFIFSLDNVGILSAVLQMKNVCACSPISLGPNQLIELCYSYGLHRIISSTSLCSVFSFFFSGVFCDVSLFVAHTKMHCCFEQCEVTHIE